MKKFFALLIAVAMIAVLGVPAFADNAEPIFNTVFTRVENDPTVEYDEWEIPYNVWTPMADNAPIAVGETVTMLLTYNVPASVEGYSERLLGSIEYLTEKYKDRVETNGRENRTPNGKLLLSDNHFALGEGKRVCFTYIYEDEGRIVMLIRASEAQAAAIHKAHPATGNRSAFPKNKEKDWYSVVVDESFTESEVLSILDGAIEYVLTK